MKSIDAQTSEPNRVNRIILPSDSPDSVRHSDVSSGSERSQSMIGNAAVAHAAINEGTGGSSAWLSRSAINGRVATPDLQQRFGNSAVQQVLRSGLIQAKLSISQPGDVYEQEADRVADIVMRMPDATASENSPPGLQRKDAGCESGHGCAEGQGIVQRKSLFSRITSFIQRHVGTTNSSVGEGELRQMTPAETPMISGSVESQLRSTRGGGQPLSSTARAFFEPRFGMDFGHVRVHTGSDATEMNRAVSAKAFSHGSDIYYGPGNSPNDLALTAHELTHVVQQTSDGAVTSDAEPAVQRAPVTTNGGSFNTTTYTPQSAPTGAVGEHLGAHIILEFMANDLVESTKIGMIQSVKAMKSSEAGGTRDTVATGVGDPEEGQLIMGSDQADPGREIDRAVHPNRRALPNTSPIYGVHNTAASTATALGHGTPTTATSQWGSHTKDPITGAFLPAVPARIDDTPGRTIEFSGQTYEHTFESAAIAVEGPIPPNTYLGSVSWGWRSNATGQVTVIPLALVRVGAPSTEFMAAAALWNAAIFEVTGTSVTHPSVDIPITSLNSGTTLPSSRTTGNLIIQIARLTAELAPMPPGPDKTNKEFEKRVLEAELARRADQPTLSLADQERAAALLSTLDLLRRSDALPAEISRLATSPARTDKELEQEGVKREIAKRKVLITVHVHETEDIIGSDSVYVTAASGILSTRTSVVNLNNGQEHNFVVPLSALFTGPPLSLASSSLFIKVYDEDWEGDDLMFDKGWIWSDLPAEETQSRDGGRYTVRIDFAQLR
ncbi:MAG: DUF4157 domain-containing protein [Blastocatellia bacterium]